MLITVVVAPGRAQPATVQKLGTRQLERTGTNVTKRAGEHNVKLALLGEHRPATRRGRESRRPLRMLGIALEALERRARVLLASSQHVSLDQVRAAMDAQGKPDVLRLTYGPI